MIAGHLQEKRGNYYIVLNCHDLMGERKTKWISTKLPVMSPMNVFACPL